MTENDSLANDLETELHRCEDGVHPVCRSGLMPTEFGAGRLFTENKVPIALVLPSLEAIKTIAW